MKWEVTLHEGTFIIEAEDEIEAIDEVRETIMENPTDYIDADPIDEEEE